MKNERRLLLQGAKNTRDLGGLYNREGKQIKEKRLIRSGHLADLSQADIRLLTEEYKARRLIDLRTSEEKSQRPDAVIPHMEYIHVPIFEKEMAGISHDKDEQFDLMKMLEGMPKMEQLYERMLKEPHCISQFASAIRCIAEEENGSVIWHCTEGKDRCGILTAFVLLILDVDRDVIYEDYMLTNLVNEQKSAALEQRIWEQTGNKAIAEKAACAFLAKKSYMDAVFKQMEEQAGSIEQFLYEKLKVDETLKAKMKQNYLR